MLKQPLPIAAMLAVTLFSTALEASPLSVNFGWNSEYIFRGIPQNESSAFGGIDFEYKGAYAGVWGADVGDGIEYDYYGGYGFEIGKFTASFGGTVYAYSGDFDDTYKEFNFSLGYAFLTFDAAVGTYDNFGGPELDYQFYSLTAEYGGFYGIIGTFEDDFDGSYYEAGYGGTLTIGDQDLMDYGFAVLYSDSTLLGGSSDTNFVFSLSKTFDL